MTLQQFLAILAARWKTSLLVLLVTVVAVVSLSLLTPKKYTATASVMLDVRSPDPVAGAVLAGMMSPAYMATQVDLMGSERVARRAIQSLGLNEDPQMREQWSTATKGQGDFEAWLSDALLQSLEIKPSRESNVISISYSSPDPNFAAAVANAFVRAYIDTSLELRVDPARPSQLHSRGPGSCRATSPTSTIPGGAGSRISCKTRTEGARSSRAHHGRPALRR